MKLCTLFYCMLCSIITLSPYVGWLQPLSESLYKVTYALVSYDLQGASLDKVHVFAMIYCIDTSFQMHEIVHFGTQLIIDCDYSLLTWSWSLTVNNYLPDPETFGQDKKILQKFVETKSK